MRDAAGAGLTMRSSAPVADPRLDQLFERYPALDPVTYQVISNRLEFVTREMGIATLRTAYSPIIVEVVDFSCAIADPAGKLAATLNYDPAHLGAIGYAAQWVVMEYGYEDLYAGDVFVQNDPYRGGTHLNDITLLRPIFVDERLLAIAANRAHHVDIGGKTPGGLAADAREIYAEGIRLPVVRWFHEGREQEDLTRLLLENVRVPRAQEADMRAQLASLLTAEQRVLELAGKYGTDALAQAIEARFDQSERGMRAAISALPDGVYEHVDFMDDDGIGGEPVRVSARVTIDGSEIEIDYSGCDPQATGPINCGYGVLASATFVALLQLLPPSVPFTGGCFRPVRITAPRGSVVNPTPPAPVFAGVTEVSMRLWDCIVAALAPTGAPELIASTYGTCLGFAGAARDPEPARRGSFTFFLEGGWGASARRDGWSAVPNQTSNFKDYPTEILENQLPLLAESVAFRRDSAGPGRNRGGFGIERVFRVLSDSLTVACEADRFETGAFGLFGGRPGAPSGALVQPAGAPEPESFQRRFGLVSASKFCDVELRAGDRFTLFTGGGGGFGDPLERLAERVLLDAVRELVSVEHAREAYGVVLVGDGDDLAVDEGATEAERARRRAEPAEPNGHVGLDGESRRRLAELSGRENLARSELDRAVATAKTLVDETICRTACSRQADGRVCPYYNGEALANWNAALFEDWTRRRCPQGERLRPAFEHTLGPSAGA